VFDVALSNEVLSVPAGRTYEIIHQHFIYSCPTTYTYKPNVRLITFRTAPPETAMRTVLEIQKVVEADPTDTEKMCIASRATEARIANYVAAARQTRAFDQPGRYRFYLLASTPVAVLAHAPRTAEPQKGACQ
jgi:hypothetical protein